MSFKIRIILRRGNITTLNLDQITERGVRLDLQGFVILEVMGGGGRWGGAMSGGKVGGSAKREGSERCEREIKLR